LIKNIKVSWTGLLL